MKEALSNHMGNELHLIAQPVEVVELRRRLDFHRTIGDTGHTWTSLLRTVVFCLNKEAHCYAGWLPVTPRCASRELSSSRRRIPHAHTNSLGNDGQRQAAQADQDAYPAGASSSMVPFSSASSGSFS